MILFYYFFLVLELVIPKINVYVINHEYIDKQNY